ncbi:MAG: ABC transporter ATP-binding protein [Candidatus Dormibacteraeota bacterium]|nr:ABC transporter ATP-binding protein [Candidatus Dormibacteraeota bacterium]MBO0746177.1 ABC transporter ATP-binding protein [Candidatus Dormibacteraeota bacterium]
MLDVLVADRVTRRHANGRGVSDISLEVAAGEILGLLGDNGAGKTTLLRVLATLDPPDRGSVRWFGVDDRRRPDVRARIGVSLDTPVHYASLTGWQNASYFAALYGVPRGLRERRLAELFQWAGIEAARDLRVREYSLGMRRRLTLVEALAHAPQLLILDEPTLALDEGGELDLMTRLKQLAGEGVGIVLATNDRGLAEVLCDRALELSEVRAGEPEAARGALAS